MSEDVDKIVEIFRSIPIADRRAALTKILHAAVPQDYGGFFVNRTASPEDQRAETLFELDGLVNAQSLGFTVEILPLMYPHLERLRGRAHPLEALDVGSRTGAGAALFADLFRTYHSWLPTWVDTLDIDGSFQEYQYSRWPNLRQSLVQDIFAVCPKTYDFVICSHTIEHIPDPAPFCRQLQKISRDLVFVYCPFEEKNPIPGHHTVRGDFIDSLGPLDKKIVKSWWARFGDGEPSDCVFFVLPPLD